MKYWKLVVSQTGYNDFVMYSLTKPSCVVTTPSTLVVTTEDRITIDRKEYRVFDNGNIDSIVRIIYDSQKKFEGNFDILSVKSYKIYDCDDDMISVEEFNVEEQNANVLFRKKYSTWLEEHPPKPEEDKFYMNSFLVKFSIWLSKKWGIGK